MNKIELNEKAKILLRLPNWVGDVVMATPSILALLREKPQAEIHFALRKHLCPLVENFPNVKRIYPIEGKKISSNFSFLKEARKEKYDAFVVFAKGFRDGVIAKFSKSQATIGFSVNHRRLLFSHPLEMTKELWNSHHTFQFAKLLSPFGIELKGEKTFLPVGENEKENALKILKENGLKENNFIVFHIGASKFARAYHSERFGKAAKEIGEKSGKEIVLIGSKDEINYSENFVKECPKVKNLVGKISLQNLKSFLSFAKLFVGNDSGPMHIAGSVGVPVVAVFGPGSPQKTAPFLEESKLRIIYKGLPCSPCRQSFFKDCEPSEYGKPPCLEKINFKEVVSAVFELI